MRAVRKKPDYKRWLSVLLCLCIILPCLNGFTLAAQADGRQGLCEHHPAHTADCGYVEAVEGRPCVHVHSEVCGYAEGTQGSPCTHEHTEECFVTECLHVHDSACYAAAEPPADTEANPGGGEEAPTASDSVEPPPPVDGEEETPAAPDSMEAAPPADGLEEGSVEIGGAQPPLAESPEGQEPVNCVHRCTEESGCVTLRCEHVHNEDCGYAAPEEAACAHVHDETCGYAEAVEGQPCRYECRLCGTKEVLSWSFDGDGALAYNDETKAWGLALPGVSQERPVTAADLEDFLPGEAEVELRDGASETAGVAWDLSGLPEEGCYGGSFFVYGTLSGEYRLAEGVPALAVLLDLGGGETYAELSAKHFNQWSFVGRDGALVSNERVGVFFASPVRELTQEEILQSVKEALPARVGGLVYGSEAALTSTGLLNVSKDPQQCVAYEYDAATQSVKEVSYPTQCRWAEADLDWGAVSVPASIEKGTVLQFRASTVSSATHRFLADSHNREDYYPDDPNAGKLTYSKKSSDLNPDILTVNIVFVELADYIENPASPANTTVNLFDYWVEDYGKAPKAPQGDILQKSDHHYRPQVDGNGKPLENSLGEVIYSDTPIGFSTSNDWNRGINAGHLLLFGDGLIHAGLWNKGAGENTEYGKKYAGMEGIVTNCLEDGYPVVNTADAKKTLEDQELVRDYKLAGDHNSAVSSDAYDGINIQNLSDTVIGTWGREIDIDSESLAYLFDPEVTHPNKISHEDVTGLFQLDNEGYYYYNMRRNFAEYDEVSNEFILYNAPATTRTDAQQSVGNFFPFNKGVEVFNGVDESGKPTSSVPCSGNEMNHHLGMTVEIDFRQPANGKINMGASGMKDMTFGFSGDDDVWVFIDDVLVLDLGGTHSEIYGTINFATGDVYIGRAFDTKGIPDDPADPDHIVTHTNLKDLFQEAGRVGETQWAGNRFASDTDHTLRMFYLERGNYDSSLALRFNLQPQLNQQIKKVDQAGMPMQGVEFKLFPAEETGNGPGAIECFYTDSKTDSRMRVQNNQKFYVTQSGGALCTLVTDKDGVAKFMDNDMPFNFADQGDRYYILKETGTPSGYRSLPVDIVLYYDTETSMLSVANRWTTGAYACSVSNILGAGGLTYGAFNDVTGDIGRRDDLPVSRTAQRDGLVVAVPMLLQRSQSKWIALYGSNLHGFGSVRPAERSAAEWRAAVLGAALRQAAAGDGYAEWHLTWDVDNHRLTGMLDDLPGIASRYQINGGEDMRMVYGVIEPAALSALGITGADAAERYRDLGEYVREREEAFGGEDALEKAIAETVEKIMGETVEHTGSGKGFSFLNVDQFNRNFRSLIYIPNEQRELWVMKVDQNGVPRGGAEFTLFRDAAAAEAVAKGVTDADGRLIFSPQGSDNGTGHTKMVWAREGVQARYYLKETGAPAGCGLNNTVIPVVVGTYSIYADAGTRNDDVSVLAGVGRLTQTMCQYAMDNDVDITLRDITAIGQYQPSGGDALPGSWVDMELETTLESNPILRSMNLHYKMNEMVDYGLHNADGGQNYKPFFVTDTGFIRARVQQNYPALLPNGPYAGEVINEDTNKDCLDDLDLTSLFSLLNIVVVTDRETHPTEDTGELVISKRVTGSALEADYTKNFLFTVSLTDAAGAPLTGTYYFYGSDKSGTVRHGDTIPLHHDESITIQGLPAGTRFKVKEELPGADSGGVWYIVPADGVISETIQKDKTETAGFINSRVEPVRGSLTIRKNFGGVSVPGEAKNKVFTFAVTGPNGYSETVYITGEGSRTLADLIPGEYQVAEKRDGIDIQDYTVSVEGEGSVTVAAGSAESVTVVNTYTPEDPATGSLRIKKTVTGSGGSRTMDFAFVVTLKKADGSALEGAYSYTGSKNGTLSSGQSVKLKHNEFVKISGLPAGTQYVVAESGHEGYTVTSFGEVGTIEGGGECEAVFNNDRSKDPPEEPEDPPKKPEEPPKEPEDPPKKPEDPPKEPEDPPKEPEDSPKTPEDPSEEPKNPPDSPTEFPDPNDPDSPDTITIWEDGVPKTYIKIWDPEKAEWVYIPENEVPLIPMTEDSANPALWKMMCLSSLAGLCALALKRKRHGEEV